MKTTILTLITILGLAGAAMAFQTDTVSIKSGQRKSVRNGEFTIKFVSVTEDSRCPVDANCIWAGNAKVQVKITGARGSKTMVMNTNAGPTGDQFDGWAIYLTELTPAPKSSSKIKPKAYKATFSIKRLTR